MDLVSTPRNDCSLVTSIIVYGDDQGEGGAERHYSGDGWCPGPLAVLNFHPTVHVVACNDHRSLSIRFDL